MFCIFTVSMWVILVATLFYRFARCYHSALNPNPIRKHFVYSDYFLFWTRPREILGNENNNLSWQQFRKKMHLFYLHG